MKILLTTDWYKPVVNGVVTSVINLKKELENRGHEVRVLTLSRNYKSYVEEGVYYIKSLNLEKIYPNARAVLPHTEPLIQELIWWRPDIVHSQCEFMTFSYAAKISRKCQCPLVHTYHTVYEDYIHYLPGGLSQYKPARRGRGLRPTAPAPGTWPQWPPWPGATRPRCRGTTRWSAPGPRRSRCASAPSRARGGAWWGRSRSGGRGRACP